jgi:hypothetical protein
MKVELSNGIRDSLLHGWIPDWLVQATDLDPSQRPFDFIQNTNRYRRRLWLENLVSVEPAYASIHRQKHVSILAKASSLRQPNKRGKVFFWVFLVMRESK